MHDSDDKPFKITHGSHKQAKRLLEYLEDDGFTNLKIFIECLISEVDQEVRRIPEKEKKREYLYGLVVENFHILKRKGFYNNPKALGNIGQKHISTI